MSHKTDFRRQALAWTAAQERALRPVNVSLGFEEWSGTWAGDAEPTGRTPEELLLIGGLWDPIGHRYIGKPEEPAEVLKVQEQQTPALISKAQFLAVLGAERSGKTFVGREISLEELLEPDHIVFYLLPKFQKKGFVLSGLIGLLDRHGWIVARDEKFHQYETIVGSKLHVFSAADKNAEETFLGGECHLAVIEEFREMPDRVFQKLFSRTISTNGRLAIVSSPEAGHMLEELDRGEWKDRVDFEIHHLDLRKNFFIFTEPPAEHDRPDGTVELEHPILEVARRLYDERTYQRKVLGLSVADTGADFYNWDPRVHVLDEMPGVDVTRWLWRSDDLWLSRDPRYRGPGTVRPDPKLVQPVICGMDFGAKVVSLIESRLCVPADTPVDVDGVPLMTWENTTLWCEREHQKFDSSTVDFVDTMMIPRGLLPERTAIFCDPAGKAREPVTGRNSVDYLRSRGYVVFCKPGGTHREPGIEAMRVRLQMRRLAVSRKGCPTLAKNMAKVRSIGRPPKEVSRDPAGHLPDGLRYEVDNLFPVRDVIVRRTAQEALTNALH